jgi:nucleoside-diphosphate-sugar epimerase
MQLSGLAERVAVVTGAASGIGQAVVRRLAQERSASRSSTVRLVLVPVFGRTRKEAF